MKQFVLRITLSLATLIVFILGGLILIDQLISTPKGQQLIMQTIQRFIPGTLEVDAQPAYPTSHATSSHADTQKTPQSGITRPGSTSTPQSQSAALHFPTNLRYQSQTIDIKINGIRTPKPQLNLPKGRISLSPVTIKQVTIRFKETDTPTIVLKHLTATATITPIEVIYTLDGQYNSTPWHIKGRYLFARPKHLFASITSKPLPIRYSSRLRLTLIPELNVTLEPSDILIAGRLTVPSASIHKPNFSHTTELPDEAIIIGEHPSKQSSSPPTPLKGTVAVTLGNKIQIDYKGLQAQPTGQLNLAFEPKQPLRADGRIQIKQGRYEVRGRALKISRGELTFRSGPIDNPELQITAVRGFNNSAIYDPTASTESVKVVGVHVTGTLQQPQIRLFSDPSSLSQIDKLSYLLFGQSATSMSKNKSQLLWNAATTLNVSDGKGVGNLGEQIQRQLGLSELGLTSVPTYEPNLPETEPALTLGKQLSPRLYLHYDIGLLDAIAQLVLRYKINKNWTFQTNSSRIGSGLDLIYSRHPDGSV